MGDFGDAYDSGQGRYLYQGQVDPNAPSLANGGISPAEWADYQARRKKDALLGVLGILGGSAGLGFLGNALGGAAAAAPEFAVSTTPLASGAVTASTVPIAAAGGAGSAGAGIAGGLGAGAGALGRTGGDLVNHKMDSGGGSSVLGMSPKDLIALAMGLTGTVGGFLSGKNNTPNLGPNTATTDPQLQKLLASMQGRLDKSEPLVDSIFAMANGLLPTQYQKGGGGMP